jgi:outer membrane cobalamin receptor
MKLDLTPEQLKTVEIGLTELFNSDRWIANRTEVEIDKIADRAQYLLSMIENHNKNNFRGEGTAQSVLDYVGSRGSVSHKDMQEYYKSLNGSNTFAYCLKNLLIPYKNRNTKRYLIKNDIGKYEIRLANPSNWVVKEY